MKRESGEKSNPIWLLINPKHPVRHDNWTPILSEIQDKVFKELHTRMDKSKIYYRCAVNDCSIVPNTLNWWGKEVLQEIELFREIVHEYRPKILITLGAFAFEFSRRVFEIKPEKGPKAWSTSNLGDEFSKAIGNFDINKTNLIPLLHKVVENGKFIDNNDYFKRYNGENYYNYVGTKLAEKIIENKDYLNIWIN